VLGFLVLVALVLAGINFTTPDRPWLTPLEKGLKDGLAPLQSGVTRVSGSIDEVLTSVFSIGRIKAENELLNEKVAKLEAENNELREYGVENLRLRQLLDFKEERLKDFELVTSKVIGRNPDNWFSTMTIDVGINDGIAKNMAVITGKGLVGRVINVARYSSEVMLIFDRNSSVGGLSQVTRTPGVLERDQDTGLLRMIHIPKDLPIREKQTIITSGFGGIYPPDLPVGKVVKVEIESNGLVKVATVRPFVDFNRLEEVFVVKKTFARPGGQ
jgi:rod shape-determining protein MreC